LYKYLHLHNSYTLTQITCSTAELHSFVNYDREVNFILELEMKAQSGSRCIAVLFL